MARIKAREVPKSVCLETSSLCNGRCVFCPYVRIAGDQKPVLMDTDVIKRVIDELAELQIERFSLFNNNEPLLDPRIQEFIRYTRKKMPDVRTTISSNGKILTGELITITIENGIDRFFISVPTLNPDAYERIMGGNLAKVLDAIFSVPEEKRRNLRIAVPRTDYYDPEQYQMTFGEAGIKWVVWDMEANADWDELDAIREIAQLHYKIGCDRPLDQAIISANGDVLICCRDWLHDNCVGNVYTDTLTSIWHGDRMRDLQEKIINGCYKDIKMCRNCSRVNELGSSKIISKVLQMCREVNQDIPSDPETKLFDAGWIDSFGAYMILAQLELEFDVQISEELMNYENFKDVNSICTLIDSLVVEKNEGK